MSGEGKTISEEENILGEEKSLRAGQTHMDDSCNRLS